MKNSLFRWSVVVLLTTTLWAQAPPSNPKPKARKTATTSTAAELKAMRETLVAQQQQIQQLRNELQQRDSSLQQVQQQVSALQSSASQAQGAAQTASTASQQNATALTAVQSTVADLKAIQTSTASSFQEEQKRISDLQHPTALHFRGITITPGGFIEAAGVFRTHNENASVNSASGNFGIPLPNSPNAHLSEFRFDARQSRLSLFGEGKIGSVKALGYYEVDFLGAAPTANENQSNSFNLRQRQLWASAEFPQGLTFTGGQQWSLLTLNRKGVANRTEFLPMTINAQYAIGYDWARQPALRVVKNFSDKMWLGFAVENASTVNPNLIVSGTGATGLPGLPPISGFANNANAQSPNGNFTLSNTPGANGVSTNHAPDLVAKVAFEPGWGHYELKGVGRFFRDRVAGKNNNVLGGGVGAATILPVVKSKVDFIAEAMVGSGIGRYGSGGGVDVTLRPDASIVPLRGYHVLAGPEVHIGKNLDIYLYYGEEYYQRYFVQTGATAAIGYGSPFNDNRACFVEQTTTTAPAGRCDNQTRYAFEVTPGVWYRFYKGNAGTLQMGMQYSYSQRTLWSGVGGAPKGIENQIYTSFRYYLP